MLKGTNDNTKFISRVFPSYVNEPVAGSVMITNREELERNRAEYKASEDLAERLPIVRDADGNQLYMRYRRKERRRNEPSP